MDALDTLGSGDAVDRDRDAQALDGGPISAAQQHLAFKAEPQRADSTATGQRSGYPLRFVRPALYGSLGATGLLIFYMGTITLAQDWGHAVQQLADDRWFVTAITLGFGLQVGLFAFLRALHTWARSAAAAGAAGVVASTGMSTGAMLACCAHHLVDVLPVVGLSGAAAFLDQYKTPLLWLAVAMNAAGAAHLLYQVRKQLISRAAQVDAGQNTTSSAPSCHVPGRLQAS